MGRRVQHTDDEKLAKLRERQRKNQANKYKRDQEKAAEFEKTINNLDDDIIKLIASCRQRLNEGACLTQNQGDQYIQQKSQELMRIKDHVEDIAAKFDKFNHPEQSRQQRAYEEEVSVVPDFNMD